jgi:hypothetical protein
MSQPNPSYVDGLVGISDLAVYCYNNLATYVTYDGDPGEEATVKEFLDSNDEPLGSDTRTGFRKGSMNLQYDLTTDELPGATKLMRPGFIVGFRNRYYVVGAVKPKLVKNDVIKFSIEVYELQNPFLPELLTTRGQEYRGTLNALTVINVLAVGARPNAVVTYTVEHFSNTANTVAGTSININTGVLTINANIGTVDLRVIAHDNLTGETEHLGWGRYKAV